MARHDKHDGKSDLPLDITSQSGDQPLRFFYKEAFLLPERAAELFALATTAKSAGGLGIGIKGPKGGANRSCTICRDKAKRVVSKKRQPNYVLDGGNVDDVIRPFRKLVEEVEVFIRQKVTAAEFECTLPASGFDWAYVRSYLPANKTQGGSDVRDKKDRGIGLHRDANVDPATPICGISLGGTRDFQLCHGGSSSQTVALQHGSLYVILPPTNTQCTCEGKSEKR